MSEIIILANSWRPGGRCIAGINVNTGKWVRPIPMGNTHAIPENKVLNFGLLDVIGMPLSGKKPKPTEKYQMENEYISSLNWEKIGKKKIVEIKKYCENEGLILHSDSDFVETSVLEKK